MNVSSRLNRLKAFTLVEVLVVIAIIAIFAAILIPVFTRTNSAKRLRVGDKVSIPTLNIKGVVDRVNFESVSVVVVGRDGYPTKMTVDYRILEKE